MNRAVRVAVCAPVAVGTNRTLIAHVPCGTSIVAAQPSLTIAIPDGVAPTSWTAISPDVTSALLVNTIELGALA